LIILYVVLVSIIIGKLRLVLELIIGILILIRIVILLFDWLIFRFDIVFDSFGFGFKNFFVHMTVVIFHTDLLILVII